MSQLFAVVHEADADFTTATELADRVLVEAIDWLDFDSLAYQRNWLSETSAGARLTWTGIAKHDREPERRQGLEQARNQDHGGIAVVVGLAIVERESWLICGFHPEDNVETARLESTQTELGFDPRECSHELTAHKDELAKRSPKRVLKALTQGIWEREQRCWQVTPLEVLRKNGKENGLADFLLEVRERFAPRIGRVDADGGIAT